MMTIRVLRHAFMAGVCVKPRSRSALRHLFYSRGVRTRSRTFAARYLVGVAFDIGMPMNIGVTSPIHDMSLALFLFFFQRASALCPSYSIQCYSPLTFRTTSLNPVILTRAGHRKTMRD